jgi:hypothetical protein
LPRNQIVLVLTSLLFDGVRGVLDEGKDFRLLGGN